MVLLLLYVLRFPTPEHGKTKYIDLTFLSHVREKEGKYYAVTGTKGYRWLESETIKTLGLYDNIDTTYHENLVSDAISNISKFGDFDSLVE